jgi:hypothetical protein
MHGAIRTYRVTDADQISRRVTEEFISLVQNVPGFVAYYVIDTGDGTLSSITIAEDSEGVEESTLRASEWIREAGLDSLIESGPEITVGEITVSQTRTGART